jgi:hypothetical protein
VFLSFRGEDTRYGFTGNLYKALFDQGIRTFIDDEELQRGEEITPSLLKSIENSRIAIIIFSKNYASSSFCLDELAHIIHYFQEKSRLVLPVFYDVEPCNVRNQTKRYDETLPMHENENRSFAEALAMHERRFQNDEENMERFLKWKKALKQAANLSGYHFKFGYLSSFHSYFVFKYIFLELDPQQRYCLLQYLLPNLSHPIDKFIR